MKRDTTLNWDTPQTTPEQEALHQLRKGINWWKIIIITTIIIAISALLLANNASDTSSQAYDKANQPLTLTITPGKQTALQKVSTYLNTQPYPLGNPPQTIDYQTGKHADSVIDANKNTIDYYTHTFTVVTKAGVTYQVTQLVSISNGIETALENPTISPVVGGHKSNGTTTYTLSQLPSLNVSDTLSSLIKTWAQAYMGKDSNQFTTIMADPNAKHYYQTLPLGVYQGVQTGWAVHANDNVKSLLSPLPDDDKDKTPVYGIVYATLSYKVNEKATPSTMPLLLLVKNPTLGSARVVDWQSFGDAKALRPYSHAVSKDALSTGDDGDDGSDADMDSDTDADSDTSTNSDTDTTDDQPDTPQSDTTDPNE